MKNEIIILDTELESNELASSDSTYTGVTISQDDLMILNNYSEILNKGLSAHVIASTEMLLKYGLDERDNPGFYLWDTDSGKVYRSNPW